MSDANTRFITLGEILDKEDRIRTLEAELKAKDERIDWTVADNAAKAVRIADLEAENKRQLDRLDRCRAAFRQFDDGSGGDEIDLIRVLGDLLEERGPRDVMKCPGDGCPGCYHCRAPDDDPTPPERAVEGRGTATVDESGTSYPCPTCGSTVSIGHKLAAVWRCSNCGEMTTVPADAAVVEGRFTCLDCDAPIPEHGYCAPCIEKMRELIDDPVVEKRLPDISGRREIFGIQDIGNPHVDIYSCGCRYPNDGGHDRVYSVPCPKHYSATASEVTFPSK